MTVLDWTSNPYPLPRKNRKLAQPPPGADPGAIVDKNPRTFLWSFYIRANAQPVRTSIASRRILGPCVIKDITGSFSNAGSIGGVLPITGLYYQTTPYTSVTQGSVAADLTGTSLFELQVGSNAGGMTAPVADGVPITATNSHPEGYTLPISRLITDPEIYLSLFMEFRASAGDGYINGHVRIFEDIDLADALLLLA